MVLAKYKAVTTDIKFAVVLVQNLEEKKKSLTMKCWKAKIDCYCISVDLRFFIPLLNPQKKCRKDVNEPCFLRQRNAPFSSVDDCSLFSEYGGRFIEGGAYRRGRLIIALRYFCFNILLEVSKI